MQGRLQNWMRRCGLASSGLGTWPCMSSGLDRSLGNTVCYFKSHPERVVRSKVIKCYDDVIARRTLVQYIIVNVTRLPPD